MSGPDLPPRRRPAALLCADPGLVEEWCSWLARRRVEPRDAGAMRAALAAAAANIPAAAALAAPVARVP